MGFKREARIYRLVWPEGHENHGLEVRVRGLSLGELSSIGGMADLDLSRDAGPEALAALDDMMALFAGKLLGWNLEDEDDASVPATFEGVKAQDADFILEIVDAWMSAVAGVRPPLSETSIGGGTSLAESIPMEPLSASQAS